MPAAGVRGAPTAERPLAAPSKAALLRAMSLEQRKLLKSQSISISRGISRILTSRCASKNSAHLHGTVKIDNINLQSARCT